MQYSRFAVLRRACGALAAAVLVIGTGGTMALADESPDPAAQTASSADNQAQADTKARAEAEAKAKQEAQDKQEAEEKAAAEAKAKADAEAKAKQEAEKKADAEAQARQEAKEKSAAEAKVRAEAEASAKHEAKAKAGADADAGEEESESVRKPVEDSEGGLDSPGTGPEEGEDASSESPPQAEGTDGAGPDDPENPAGESGETPIELTAPAPEFIEAPSADDVALIRLAAADCVAWDIDGTPSEAGDHEAPADAQVMVKATAGEGCALTGQATWAHAFGTPAEDGLSGNPGGTAMAADAAGTPAGLDAGELVPAEGLNDGETENAEDLLATNADVPEAGLLSAAAALAAPVPVNPPHLNKDNKADPPASGQYTTLISTSRYVDVYVIGPSTCGGMATVRIFAKAAAGESSLPSSVGPSPDAGTNNRIEVNKNQSAYVTVPGNSTFSIGVWYRGADNKWIADPVPVTVGSGCPSVTLTASASEVTCEVQTGSVSVASAVSGNPNSTLVDYTYTVNGGTPMSLGSSPTGVTRTITGLAPGATVVVYAAIRGGETSQASATVGMVPADCSVSVAVTSTAAQCAEGATGNMTVTVTNNSDGNATLALTFETSEEVFNYPAETIEAGRSYTFAAGGLKPGYYTWSVGSPGSDTAAASGGLTVSREPCPVAAPHFTAPTCEAPTGTVTVMGATGVEHTITWASGSEGSPGGQLLLAGGLFASGTVVPSGTLMTSSLLGTTEPISVTIWPSLHEDFAPGTLGAAEGSSWPWSFTFTPIDPASCLGLPEQPVDPPGDPGDPPADPGSPPGDPADPAVLVPGPAGGETASDVTFESASGPVPAGPSVDRPNVVDPPAAVATPAELPYSGASLWQMTALGLALIGAGLVLVATRRWRSAIGR